MVSPCISSSPATSSKGKADSKLIRAVVVLLIGSLTSCALILPRETAPYIAYPIKQGDTLYSISQRFDVSTEELRSLNHIRNPRTLQVGTVIKVPYHGQSLKRGEGDVVRSPQRSKGDSSKTAGLARVELGRAARYVGQLVWPVKAGQVSSVFGRRWLSFHEGIDIRAPEGQPMYAAHDGKVVYSGDGLRGYGNLIVLKGAEIVTVYGHNRRNHVRVGELVRRGQHIADVGQSGKATGPHLHFETRIKNERGKLLAVDPLAFYPGR